MNLVGVHGPNKKTKGKREENENFIIRINRKKNHRSFTEDYFKGKKIYLFNRYKIFVYTNTNAHILSESIYLI